MLQQSSQAALQPSSQRPVPLRKRGDLIVEDIEYRNVAFPVIKDPVGLQYNRLQPEQYGVLNLLDGNRSLEQIRDELQAQFPTVHVTPSDVQQLITDLHEKGLLISSRLGQGESMYKRKREKTLNTVRQTAMNPLYLRLPGWDPDTTLTKITPYLGWLFTKWAGILAMLFVMSSWLFLAIRFDDVRQKLPEFQQFFGWPNLIYLWVTMAFAKILHEFGHGISCKRFGGECHSMGVMLLVFSPTLYCDVTDSWMMKNKWHRIIIGAAGMYVEIILAAAAIFFWYNTKPGLLNHLALNIFFVSTVTTVIFNANPLLRYDGYYMMSDFLEIPNLRAKATKLLQQAFAFWCFGIETPEDPFMPTSGKHWFVLFSIASALYRWFVLIAITTFLYTVLKPYRLQSIGIMLAIGSMGAILSGMGWNLYKLFSTPRNDPISKLKVTITSIVMISLLIGALFMPLPFYEEAAVYIEPVGVRHIYTAVPGYIDEIHHHADEVIKEGESIIQMRAPELVDVRDQLIEQRNSQEAESKTYTALKDPEGKEIVLQRLNTINKQLIDIEKQLVHLSVESPISGRVIAPPRQQRLSLQKLEERLPTWHGTPLDEKNKHTYIEEGTQLCSIAPSNEYHVVMLIQQSDRSDLEPGDSVRIKLDEFPGSVFNGKVKEFSNRHLEFAPPALSNKFGGPLATVSDSSGREKLTAVVYQAMVEIDADSDQLRTGMRGNARFIVAKRTLSDWLWRWFRQTFHFRL